MEEHANEEVADHTCQFDRLPDELIVSMFNRISDDLKFLFHCTLVSKRFASIVYQIHTVSARLPSVDVDSKEANDNVDHVFWVPPSIEPITRLIQPPSIEQKLKMITFLEKFQELESVYLEFRCPRTPCTSPFLKWKAKLGSCEPIVESLVSVLPTLIHPETGYEVDIDQEWHTDIDFFKYTPERDCLAFPLTSCSEWLVLVFSLIKGHLSLQRVTCTDSHKHGTLVLKDEQIFEWRKKLLLCDEPSIIPSARTIDLEWFYDLHLPLAGYWMADMYFVFINFIDGPGEEHEQELENSATWEYNGDEKMLGEAVKKIVTGQGDMIMWELHPR